MLSALRNAARNWTLSPFHDETGYAYVERSGKGVVSWAELCPSGNLLTFADGKAQATVTGLETRRGTRMTQQYELLWQGFRKSPRSWNRAAFPEQSIKLFEEGVALRALRQR